MRYSYSRHQTWTWTVVCSCLSMWIASQSWGFEDVKPAVGLTGLIPAYAPAGLTEQDFSDLTESIDDSWKDWTKETAGIVKDFYEGNHTTIAAQQTALDLLKVKLKTVKKALSDSRYQSIYPELSRLYGVLAPEVEISDAILSSFVQGPEQARAKRLTPSFEKLKVAVNAVDADLNQFNNGQPWKNWASLADLSALQVNSPNAIELITTVKKRLEGREFYTAEAKAFSSRESFLQLEDALGAVLAASNDNVPDAFNEAGLREAYSKLLDQLAQYRADPSIDQEGAIRRSIDELRAKSPDGGVTVVDAIGRQFMNYNLRVTASEGLLNRFVSETRTEQSQIREQMMEANVYGNQVTQVTSSIKLVPNPLVASFNLTLNGVVRSNANGYAQKATIQSVGYHTFSATRPVTFDGQEFTFGPSQVYAQANNQAVGASTHVSNVPLFGRIANRIAIREANSRSPQTNAMTVQRIRQQVSTNLDTESADQLSNASKQLQTKTYGPLRKYNLYPDEMLWSTTHSELRLSTRLMDALELGGSQSPPVASVPANGAVVQIHESLLTHSFDRIGLKGQTMTEDQVRELLESRLSEILDREVKIKKSQAAAPEAEQRENILVFDEKDAVRFTIHNGVVTIIIRAGLKREGAEDIPTQIISVPFTPTLSDGKIILTRGNVGVKPISRPPNVAAQVARAQVMRQKIQSALPEQTIDGSFKVKLENKQVDLSLVDLSAEGGWLTLGLK
ncbi:MAG TPA: hypothetical protein VNQ76_14820 [Planctomicrobium sp.]|nr:hypothetical protein [Planctomicrobium sp.]